MATTKFTHQLAHGFPIRGIAFISEASQHVKRLFAQPEITTTKSMVVTTVHFAATRVSENASNSVLADSL